ncbi:predicted protein [Uncinocarpus reesii 1704]|uniref:Protein kinase domain-containing protein n=1 Tax=Uncinocarpus reesii (strain UAMH 1704) TaxID=336963 RepID=C4JGA1_UNCRE|nr:uncharacterized protein UREG_02499 [Uncinocarpus reesii 1704]EEP77650.1 predicted protein [Uncinocarpus reesii 1704]
MSIEERSDDSPVGVKAVVQRSLAEATKREFLGVGCGSFCDVFLIPNTQLVIKIPFDVLEDDVEPQVYKRLGAHPRILQCFGEFECILGRGLVFEYLPLGKLAQYIAPEHFPSERKQWSGQAIEAILYIHSKGVIHCDVGIQNFLIRDNGSLVLADFYGSILDGSQSEVSTRSRYSRPLAIEERQLNQTERDDIFALGSVLYEIESGHRLYRDKTDREIHKLFQLRQFPDISNIAAPLRFVIEKCWWDQYKSTEGIKSDDSFSLYS